MRFAVFSDIHANLEAWEAVLADIRTQGIDTMVCLGDVVGYGPMPGPVLESVYQHTDNFVLGNHDAVVGGRIDAATFNEHAQYVIKWTADQLGEEGAAFFAQVPLTLRGEKMLFTHGDAARPGHFDYVVKAEDARPSFQACKDELIFFGHTHDPGVFACANNKGIIDKLPGDDIVLKKGRRYMVNPGSVGDPRCATDLRASYCIYDDTTRMLNFRKVEFDVEAYRANLVASGLEMQPYFLRVIDAGSRRPEEEEEMAIVQDHREEVEVDESLTVQPRALVTVGSPMANRPKLHFGYTPVHAAPQGYPPQAPQGYPGMARPGMAQTQPMHPMQQRAKGNHSAAVVIVGVLVGLVGLIFAISQMSGPSEVDMAEVGEGKRKAGSKDPDRSLLSAEDGWEDADPDRPGGGESTSAAGTSAGSEASPPVEGLGGPEAVFSLSALEKDPFKKYAISLPAGVELVDSQFGGKSMRFSASADGIELSGLEEINFGGSISVACWIRVKPADYERVIFRRARGTSTLMFMSITSAQDDKPGCVIFGGAGLTPGSVRSSSKTRVDDGNWHFVMGMHDEEEGKLRVYLDGKISKAANSKGTFPRTSTPLTIGGGGFEGEIYGLRIFDWPLHTKDMQKVHKRMK